LINCCSPGQRKDEDQQKVAGGKPDEEELNKFQSQSRINRTDQLNPPDQAGQSAAHLPQEKIPGISEEQQQVAVQRLPSTDVIQQQQQQEVSEKQNKQNLPQSFAFENKQSFQQQQPPVEVGVNPNKIPPQNFLSDDKKSSQQQQPAEEIPPKNSTAGNDKQRLNSGGSQPDNQPLVPELNSSLTAAVLHQQRMGSSVPDAGQSSSWQQRGQGGGEPEVLKREERSAVVQGLNGTGSQDQQQT